MALQSNQTVSTTTDLPPEQAAINELNEIFAGDDSDPNAGGDDFLPTADAAAPEPTPAPETPPVPEGTRPPSAETPPAATSAEVPPPAVPMQAAEPPAASPAAPAPQPAAATPAPQAPTAASAPTQEEVAKQMEELAKVYGITEDEALLFQTEPEKALPKMAARVHANIVMQLGALLPQVIPQILQQQSTTVELETKAKNMILDAWPTLKDHMADVARVGSAYRAANPTATAEEAIQAIGFIVSQSLKLPLPERVAPPPAAAPAAPTPPAFRPAGAGGSRGEAPKPTVWEGLAQDD